MNHKLSAVVGVLLFAGWLSAQQNPALEQGTKRAARQERTSQQLAPEPVERDTRRRTSPASIREWTSTDGRVFDAALLGYEIGSVTLETPIGKQVKVPIDKLSQSDKRFIVTWLHREAERLARESRNPRRR